MDALSRILMQYDAMRSEGHEEPPPWQPEDTKPVAPVPQPKDTKPAEAAIPPKPSAVTLAETANRTELDRLGFKDKKNRNDVRGQKQDNAAALLEQRLQESRKKIDQQEATMEQNMRSAVANKKLMDRIAMPNGGVSFKQDEKGMDAAYGYKSFPGGSVRLEHPDSLRCWL